jgi:hypothetical protein
MAPEPKVPHRIHNSLPTVPILRQVNPLHAPPARLPKVHFDPIYTLVFQVVTQQNITKRRTPKKKDELTYYVPDWILSCSHMQLPFMSSNMFISQLAGCT